MASPARIVLTIYRHLVALAPREARERFGDEQVRLFERLWIEERPHGALRSAAWTAAQMWRAACASIALWIDRRWRRRGGDLVRGGRSGGGWRLPVLMDLRFAVRSLRHAPWYSASTIVVLASSVALVTTAFAVVDGVLFKPLAYARPAELNLVRVDLTSKPSIDPPPVDGFDLDAWAGAVPELGVAGISMPVPYSIERRDYGAVSVDEHFFEVLGARPLVGGFQPEDFDTRIHSLTNPAGFWQPLIVSYRVWQRAFGGDPAVIGRAVTLGMREGRPVGYRIRGVLARDFAVPLDLGAVVPDVLTTMPASEMRRDSFKSYQLIVRIPSAANVTAVRDRLLAATRRLALSPPPPSFEYHMWEHLGPDGWRPNFDDVRLVPLAEHLGWRNRQAFAMVFAAAATLLLLACVNVAGLAAGRSLDRRRELAVRRALGASTWALSRALIVETGLIAVVSTALALWLVQPLLNLTLNLLPASVSLLKTPDIDARVVAASVVFALVIVGLVVWWPALVANRVSLPSELSRGGAAASRLGRRSSFVIVASQVALGFMLLSAAGLTIASLARTWRSDAGYDRDRLVVLPSFLAAFRDLPEAEVAARVAAFGDVLRRVNGVSNVGASNFGIFAKQAREWTEVVPRGWSSSLSGLLSARVDQGFFDVMGLPLVEGRWPSPGEWTDRANIAIVSRTAARMLWPNRSAIGQVLVATSPTQAIVVGPSSAAARTVIAVVGDARYRVLDRDPIGNIYLPEPIAAGAYGSFFVVRTTGPAGDMVAPLVATAKASGFRVEDASSLRDALFASVKHRVLPAWLFGSLGLVALLVLGAGILGLFATAVARRTREMGIRIALGASSECIIGLLVREQLVAVGVGLVAGGIVSLWTVRGLASQLYGIRPYDPMVWTAVSLTVIGIAVGATIGPAIRATRADPVAILRAE